MDYFENPAPPGLRRYVRCIWELRDDAPEPGIQVIYPDGCCELIAEYGTPLRFHHADGHVRDGQRLVFAGQQCGPIRLEARGPVHCLGVRLTPAASGLVARARLPQLRDQAPELFGFDPTFAEAFDVEARAAVGSGSNDALWHLLETRCREYTLDKAVERGVTLIDRHNGALRIADVALQIGLRVRSLQARFLASVGMTAKEYARVRRLQALLRAFEENDSSLAQAATDHGFADQSHATHDILRLTGTTPARLVHALRHHRDGMDTLRLAAAFVRGHA